MAGAHEGDDDRAFYHASIGITFALLAVGVAGAQTSDDDGALLPGRYLIQVGNFSDPAALCWIHVGAWEESSPLALGAVAGRKRVPFVQGGLIAIETNVLTGDSDRIGAQSSIGTCDVYITKVSR